MRFFAVAQNDRSAWRDPSLMLRMTKARINEYPGLFLYVLISYFTSSNSASVTFSVPAASAA